MAVAYRLDESIQRGIREQAKATTSAQVSPARNYHKENNEKGMAGAAGLELVKQYTGKVLTH